jgi:osmotically-inducible protein OsmY
MSRQNRERGRDYDRDRGRGQERETGRRDYGRYDNDRGLWDRGTDEVRSWFGDDEAERRRRMDEMRERDRGNRDWAPMGRNTGRNMGRDTSWNMGRNQGQDYGQDYGRDYGRDYEREYGQDYGRQSRTSDRMNDQMNYGRSSGREYDTSYGGQDYDRYGMGSTDWRQMDNYWRNTYDENYPRGRDLGRNYGQQSWGQQSYGQQPGNENFAGEGGPTNWMSTRNPNAQQQSHMGRGPRNYKRSDDRILEDVNERLTRHHMIDASDIEVTVHEGEVTLRGHVDQRETKRMAEDVAEAVSGVKNVRNEIRVQQQQTGQQEKKKGDRAA